MTLLDLLIESFDLLFEWCRRIGSMRMENVHPESALVKNTLTMPKCISGKVLLHQIFSGAVDLLASTSL